MAAVEETHFYGKKARLNQPVVADLVPLEGSGMDILTEDEVRYLESSAAKSASLARISAASPGAQGGSSKSLIKSIADTIDVPALLFEPVGAFTTTTQLPTAGSLTTISKQLEANAAKRRKKSGAPKPIRRRASNPDEADEAAKAGAAAGSSSGASGATVDRDPRLVEAYKHVAIVEDLTKMTKHVRTELVAGTKWKGAITTVDTSSGRPVRKAENYTLEVSGFDSADRVLCGKHVRKSKVELVGHVTIKVLKATGKSGVKLMILIEDDSVELTCIGGMHAEHPTLKGIVMGKNISGEFSLERVE